jgi:hypothetical protein
MLFVDGVLYFLLTIYFDNVLSGEYGRAKSVFFCFMPSYWLDKKRHKMNNLNFQINLSEVNEDCEPIPVEFNSKIALKF